MFAIVEWIRFVNSIALRWLASFANITETGAQQRLPYSSLCKRSHHTLAIVWGVRVGIIIWEAFRLTVASDLPPPA